MKEKVGYVIDKNVKNEYDNFIEDKFGHKRNNCGSELIKSMKLYLTINGNPVYSDDPEVQELLGAAKKIPCAHTQQSSEPKNESNNDLLERITKLEKQLAEHEKKETERKIAKEQHRYRDHSMDGLVSRFYDEYGEDEQVSINEISKLIMKVHGVVDKRSIMNRVDYLLASGYIESFAPNVFNIKGGNGIHTSLIVK